MHFRQNHKGWTLVELLVVIMIIGILTALVIPNIMFFKHRGARNNNTVPAVGSQEVPGNTQTFSYGAGQAGLITVSVRFVDGEFEASVQDSRNCRGRGKTVSGALRNLASNLE